MEGWKVFEYNMGQKLLVNSFVKMLDLHIFLYSRLDSWSVRGRCQKPKEMQYSFINIFWLQQKILIW